MIKILITIVMFSFFLEAGEVFKTYQIMDNGKKITIKAKETTKNSKKIHITKDGKKFDKNVKIIVKFSKNIDIKQFCKKYGLKLDFKMVTGHYIFKNTSSTPTMELIKKIMDSETKVSTIIPNWQLNQKKQ